MVPERQDYHILLINKHDIVLLQVVAFGYRFLLIYEAHRRRNTLPSLAAALEKLPHNGSLTSSRSVSYDTRTSCQALPSDHASETLGAQPLRV
jgi:hypothetical protein